MRIVLQHSLISICFIYWTGLVFSQSPKVVKLEKPHNEMDYAPQIQGIFTGAIKSALICHPEGIILGVGWKILTYDIEFCAYPNNPIHIVGSQIPDSICVQLNSNCVNTDVWFNNIKAIDDEGKVRFLSPMRLRPIQN